MGRQLMGLSILAQKQRHSTATKCSHPFPLLIIILWFIGPENVGIVAHIQIKISAKRSF
jgi:hypothetical protein